MARRSAILTLPEKLKAELDRRLVASGFAGYDDLAKWLAENGHQIGKSSVHRYGSKFEERMHSLKLATEQANAIVNESPDTEGAMGEALTRLVQEKLFTVLMDLQVDPETIDVHKLGRMIADLGRASISQKKWTVEARKHELEEATKRVDKIAVGLPRKLDAEALALVRAAIRGDA